MCGATNAQTELQKKQADFYDNATMEAKTTFGEDQAILKNITDVYTPIFAKGPNQHGFSEEELQNLNSQATEGTAQNYQKAARAVGEQIAAQGGGNIPMPTGADIERKQEVANSAAQEESRQKSQIIAADYGQGHKQFEEASQNLLAASGQLNPTAYNNSATESGNAASKTANDIAQADNSWVNAALGAVGGLGSAVISENPGNIFG